MQIVILCSCELAQVVDEILVACHVKPEVGASHLLHLLQINVVAEVVSLQVSVLGAVLFKLLDELLEFFASQEDVTFIALTVVSVVLGGFEHVGRSIFIRVPGMRHHVLGETAFAFDQVHLLLELLAVEDFHAKLLGRALTETSEVVHPICFLRLGILVFCAEWVRPLRQQIIHLKQALNAGCRHRAHR